MIKWTVEMGFRLFKIPVHTAPAVSTEDQAILCLQEAANQKKACLKGPTLKGNRSKNSLF